MSPLWIQRSSAAFIYQARTVDATVGDAAGTNQNTVARSTGEVTAATYRAIILPLGATKLQTQPKAWGKVCCAQVTDQRHLVGAAEQDLHAHVEANLPVRDGRGAGPCRAPRKTDTTAKRVPAPPLRVGTTSSFQMNCGSTGENAADKDLWENGLACKTLAQKVHGSMLFGTVDWSSIHGSLSKLQPCIDPLKTEIFAA